jgi:hypothetical protein
MACSWYAQYRYAAKESRSSAFITLVSALECLALEKEVCKYCKQPFIENVDLCQQCGQPRYRVTVHFHEFLKKYVPGIDNFPKEKKAIYQIRSQLAHGTDLLQADLEPWNFLVDGKEEEQGRLQSNLFSIARLAIYNWLHTVPVAG